MMSGIPSGTIPIFFVEDFLVSDEKRISLMESINKIIPPAIRKSSIVMPRKLNINFPKTRKITAITNAAETDSKIIFLFSFSFKSSVMPMNIGTVPIISIATNNGMNASIKVFISML